MTDDALYHDAALADFYDLENGWAQDLEYCRTLAARAGSVLDLGCGTGELAVALSGGRQVTGVDPAGAMLAIARAKPGAETVRFVEGDARSIRLGQRFDLVVLTGHAFQVFLTEADQRAALATIAAHLAPGGTFIFDSRNPATREWLEWVPEASTRDLDHPRLGAVTAWNDMRHDAATGIVAYDTIYEIKATGERLAATSEIRFTDKARLETLIGEAGLAVDRWLGDWHGAPWHEQATEIIPLGRLA
jgi:SAM-dependent methyltransferase